MALFWFENVRMLGGGGSQVENADVNFAAMFDVIMNALLLFFIIKNHAETELCGV